MSPIELLAWDDSGCELLEALNTVAGKQHLGGPEGPEKLADRQARYLTCHTPGDTEMLRIGCDSQVVGAVGYWQRDERDGPAYEIGWEIVPPFHGRGIGTAAATAILRRLQPVARHPQIYAYPTPDNAGSNGICRKLGFMLLDVEDVEYPTDVWSPHNIWRLDLPRWLPPAS